MGIVILTQSRGAVLALGIVVLALISLRFRRGWLALPTSLLALILLMNSIGADNFFDTVSTGISLGGIEGRIDIWSRAVYMIQDFPVTGIGMGLFGEVADLLYPFFLAPPQAVPHAHNVLLQIAVDLGLPGLIAWLSTWMIVSYTAWRLFRHGKVRNSDWTTGLGAGLLGSQIALLTHGMVDATIWGMVKPAPLVWVIWGYSIACGNLILTRPKHAHVSET